MNARPLQLARHLRGSALVAGIILFGLFPGNTRAGDPAFSALIPQTRQPEGQGGGVGRLPLSNSVPPRRSAIIKELRDDFKFIVSDRMFYTLTVPIFAAPLIAEGLFEREPQALSQGWINSATADAIFEPGEVLGHGLMPLGASLVLHASGKLAHAPAVSALASDLLRAHAINALLTHALKRTINRARPGGSPYGYPSGHTSSAFAAAGVVAHAVGRTWGLVARGGAVIVAISRLQENVHYGSDVVAGAILGSYVASAVVRRQERVRTVAWAPWSDGSNMGVILLLSLP